MPEPVIRPEIGAFLRAGDLVQIRAEDEILGTLDASGRLAGLPFMPEMLRHCGETHRVFKRADKTCDSIWSPGIRRMAHTVLISDLRCDGSAHGGCQAGCLFFWREEWLRRPEPEPAPIAASIPAAPMPNAPVGSGVCTRTDLFRATTGIGFTPGPEAYSCQATELGKASVPLPRSPRWDMRQYAGDVRSGNVSFWHVVTVLVKATASSLAYRLRRSGLRKIRIPTARWSPKRRDSAEAQAPVQPTPVADPLGGVPHLQAGDRVRVRSRKEIEATLDLSNRNRGLSFNSEMHRYCGGEYRVLRRVERIINESSGQMITLKDDIILDCVTCMGDYHDFCPRAVYPFWREAWLERLD